ncbi:MAG: Universal stress protein UspA-binding protein [Armatimonadetes bacterium OLB18]|nr:MAG: Universal stress protein UspA-binding protein [Armatimonadetes bacterium OLB18]
MNVVLATDGSGHSRLAEAVLAKVLDPSKTKVTAVSVSAPIVVGMGTIAGGGVAAVGGLTELYDAVKVAAERFAEEATERLRGKGFDAEAVVLEGDAADTLIEFVERNDAHLVVIGSRGLGGIASFLLGSVARKLVSRCPSTVLIARAFEGMSPEESIEALNAKAELDAVVAIDGSDGSKVAMRWIQQRVSMSLAALHVVCADLLESSRQGSTHRRSLKCMSSTTIKRANSSLRQRRNWRAGRPLSTPTPKSPGLRR